MQGLGGTRLERNSKAENKQDEHKARPVESVTYL
jgi:hypothetical protein